MKNKILVEREYDAKTEKLRRGARLAAGLYLGSVASGAARNSGKGLRGALSGAVKGGTRPGSLGLNALAGALAVSAGLRDRKKKRMI